MVVLTSQEMERKNVFTLMKWYQFPAWGDGSEAGAGEEEELNWTISPLFWTISPLLLDLLPQFAAPASPPLQPQDRHSFDTAGLPVGSCPPHPSIYGDK